MVKRKRPAAPSPVEKEAAKVTTAADAKTLLTIDTDNLKAAAAGEGSRTDGTSPVFSPARVGSPDNNQSDKVSLVATDAAARTAVKTNPVDDLVTPTNEVTSTATGGGPKSSAYAAGDILAVRDASTAFLLCRVVGSEKNAEGALRVAWYDRESAGDFTSGAADGSAAASVTRPKGRDSPLIAGETLGLFRSGPAEVATADTIHLDSVLLKLKTVAGGAPEAERLTLTEDDCAKLDQIAMAGAVDGPTTKRPRT
jgi:hypothetical protein